MKTKFDLTRCIVWSFIIFVIPSLWIWLAVVLFTPEPIDKRTEYLNGLSTFTESEWNEFYPNLK